MVGQAFIASVASHLPPNRLTNEDLARRPGGWAPEKTFEKTGIRERRVVDGLECASDLAAAAAARLFARGACDPAEVDILIHCTQTPDYLLPTTACLLQERLMLPTHCMAFDINQGCSGYIYGLALAKSLLESGMGRKALLLTGDTYSRFIPPDDRTVATLFGDAGTATSLALVDPDDARPAPLGPFVFGTDGSGAENLIVPDSAFRRSAGGGGPVPGRLFMNGPKIFEFTLKTIPALVLGTLEKAGLALDDVDLFVFHQANRFMLEALRQKLGIDPNRFVFALEETGNTVSSSIPVALEASAARGRIRAGDRLLLVGFGVGYSWGAAAVRWATPGMAVGDDEQ